MTKIRVYTNEPTNYGNEKVQIKLFNTQIEAEPYFKKLIKETKKEAKETDDSLYVIMEEIASGKIIKSEYFN